jgi:3',5'-cyclic-AMP phosphodiesterase
MLIAQLSDVHVGGGRYREELLRAAIEEINTAAPDLVVVAGDITDEGYPDQYPLAKEELSALACPLIVRVPGNHDARNVRYLHFEDTFGARDSRLRLDQQGFVGVCQRARVMPARVWRHRSVGCEGHAPVVAVLLASAESK